MLAVERQTSVKRCQANRSILAANVIVHKSSEVFVLYAS